MSIGWPMLYLAAMAFLPLVFSTARSMSREKVRDRVFMKTVAKDYLRTLPAVALVSLPLALFPQAARGYLLAMHLVFAWMVFGDMWHVHLFGARAGVNTWYSMFVTTRGEVAEYIRNNMTVAQWLLIAAVYLAPAAAIWLLAGPVAFGELHLSAAGREAAVSWRWVWAAALALLSVPLIRNCFKRGARHKQGYMLNPFVSVFYHYYLYSRRYRLLLKQIAGHSAPPFEGIASCLPAGTRQTVVVCIGESANSMHHSYAGYSRRTNEFTDALGDVVSVKGVRSQYAQTLPSLEKTITFATDANPDALWSKGSIIDYFKDAGFKTFWLSNQYALDDTVVTALTSRADRNKCYNFGDMKRFEKAGLDGDMLPDFEKAVLSPGAKKRIVFMHLIGSHSAYVNRYPSEFRHFTGQAPGKSLPAAKAQMLNAYDDSVRYTDWFVARCVEILRKSAVASYLLYFSDHGEDVFDSVPDRILGHSQLANVPMTAVPMMLWVSDRLDSLRPDIRKRASAAGGRYDLTDVIHTIIDVSSLSSGDFASPRSILNSAPGPEDRP